MLSTFLVTSSDEFENAARNELRRYDSKLKPGETLLPGLFLIASQLSWDDFAAIASQDPPIYCRHFFPVQATVAITKTEADLAVLAEAVVNLARLDEALTAEVPFGVQARLLEAEEGQVSSFGYTPFGVKEKLAVAITERTGAVENIREPEEILSVVAVGETAYIGLSPAELNVSSWPGGMRRFAKRPEQVSRAELKLQEALEVFGAVLPTAGAALDLGAAPGGWTRLLLAAGLQVTAIDPATLDPRLEDLPGLTHYRGYAERFLATALSQAVQKGHYMVIGSDLRMDAALSARLMVSYAPLLNAKGFAIMTLKLPHESAKLKPAVLAEQAMAILGQAFKVVHARQLFHNRQEITVFLRKG